MGQSGFEQFVQAFYAAYVARDPLALAVFLADDVEWTMTGPDALFPLCGYRRGKAAVIDFLIRQRASVFQPKLHETEQTITDGNCFSSFAKVTCIHTATGRVIVFYCANFITLRAGKVASMVCMADTFSAAEQIVGHRIDAFRWRESSHSKNVLAL